MRRTPAPTRTMSSPWRWAGLGAVTGLLLAGVLWAPARWLAGAVAQASQGQIQLRQARGTVWSGDAVLSLAPTDAHAPAHSLPGRVHWQWGLAWPALALRLSTDCCTPQPLLWQLSRQDGQLQLALADQSSSWPLTVLAGLGAPWNTLQADGRLLWHSRGLRLSWAEGRLRWHGQAELQVQELASRLSTLRPMGSYRIVLAGADAGTATPTLSLSTLTGPLHLSGQGQWVGRKLHFSGEASADAGSEAALSNLLNIIGRREGPRSRLSLG